MSQFANKIAVALTSPQRDRQPVTIRRKYLDVDETSGFVVAVAKDWVVMHDLVQTVYLDDLVFLRLDHVTKVEPHQDQAYVSRAVAGLGEPIKEFVCAPDASISDLLAAIAERQEWSEFTSRSSEGDWINFGRIRRIGNKRLHLQFIGRDGVWVDSVDAWKLKDITRLEVGGRYAQALDRFGDPIPAATSRKKRSST